MGVGVPVANETLIPSVARLIWLEPNVVDRLAAMPGPGESYGDVILRIAGPEGAH